MKAYAVMRDARLHFLYPWCYVEVSEQLHAPLALPLGKNPVMHLTGGCVGPRADIDMS